ncbi:pseudouridine synthase [Lentisphaera profundi]|uniref:Pseudouridine synthase n=1 Tax=Lentisphaera profundi TaxID=1658616 RepID=A0ABY7W0I0_9BACT|nr:pseudouridine synthase [Lentisphaera profundi]WDE97783.1 pseudouridine synthase [Lentisphaera profundi]
MRLDRFVCKSTDFTKNEALQLIHAGEVLVNDEAIINEATQVHENNTIILHGNRLKTRAFRYLLMHKPINTICSNIDEKSYPSLFNLLDVARTSELHIAGRLDADTSGLVLMTDDGRWTFNIISPSKNCKKVYRVGLSREISGDVVEQFKEGVQLQGETKLTLPAELTIITPKEVLLSLTEGKFHQVKRMFAAVGNKVISLHREKIGAISLDVDLGEWRHLTLDEVKALRS